MVTGVDLIQDLTGVSPAGDGFLRRHRHRVKTKLSDGHRSETFIVDYADRQADRRDAVAAVVYSPTADDQNPNVLLRRQFRYPVWVGAGTPTLLEVPAGIIEGPESILTAALRETLEETGIEADAKQARRLGAGIFPSPGTVTEQVDFVALEVAPEAMARAVAVEPPGDGSAMEQGASLEIHPLLDVLATFDDPEQREPLDAKTEIGLRRLARALQTRD